MSTNKTNNLKMHSWTGTDYVKRTEFNENFDAVDKLAGLQLANGEVRVATTANITLSGTQTIDGIAVVAGDRVLVKNQTTASANGIYDVASGAWIRSYDADSSEKVKAGIKVFVKEGTANGKEEWRLSTTGAITLGTTSLTFELVNGPDSATDTYIGNRTVNQATGTAFANTGALTQILSWFAKQLKAITGATNWYDTPAATLSSLNTNKANLASPTFTGTPAGPTASAGTNTTQLATTAFVTSAVANNTHPTGDGNLHVPATGTTNDGKVLKAGATAGSIAWGVVSGSEITQNASYRFVSDTEKATWNAKASTAVATTGANGLMSAADKSKLDGIEASANNYSHPSGDGNLHVPATSTTNDGKVLKAGATAGSIAWGVVNASEVVEDTSHRFVTDDEKTTWNAKASTASPTFTGTPAAPTPSAGTNTTQIATTAYVQSELAADLATVAPVMDGTAAVGSSTLKARQDHRHPTDTTRAPLASPALTGTPTAPTAAAGTNTTQIATTAYVQSELSADLATVAPLMNGTAAVGTSSLKARQDHVHPTDTTRAPLASPTFTGTVVLPSTTSIGNVSSTEIGYLDGVTSAIQTQLGAKAPLASPVLTGTPTAPTAAVGTNTTQVATTAFVLANKSNGVEARTTDPTSPTVGQMWLRTDV